MLRWGAILKTIIVTIVNIVAFVEIWAYLYRRKGLKITLNKIISKNCVIRGQIQRKRIKTLQNFDLNYHV